MHCVCVCVCVGGRGGENMEGWRDEIGMKN